MSQALVFTVAGAFLVQLVLLGGGIALAQWGLSRWPGAIGWLGFAAFPVPLAGVGAVITGAGFRVGLAWATLGFVFGLMVTGMGR
jgi:hypothetical protein